MRAALEGKDLVINAALPRYNLAIMAAALEADVDYLDLAGGGEDQLRLSPRWRNAGRTAVLGMGEDPGIGNVLARCAADALDTVDSVKIRDGETSRSGEYEFVCLFSPETFIEETLADGIVYEDGVWRTVPPLSGYEEYPFPPPVGRVPVYVVSHEEVETIPRFLGKPVRSCDFKLALLPETVAMLRRIEREGLMKGEKRAKFLATIPPPADLAGKITGFATILVEVKGTRDGRRETRVLHATMDHVEASKAYGTTGTAYLTGTGAAVGSLLLLDGRTPRGGVFVPEQLNPGPVFDRLRGMGVDVRQAVRAA